VQNYDLDINQNQPFKLKKINRPISKIGQYFGLSKNTPNTIKLAQANEIKHMMILKGIILNPKN
jgi:adenylate cyclase